MPLQYGLVLVGFENILNFTNYPLSQLLGEVEIDFQQVINK